MVRNESGDLIKHYIGESLEQWLWKVFKTFYYIEGNNLIECRKRRGDCRGLSFLADQLTLSQSGGHIMPTMGTLKIVCSSWFALISRDKYEHTHLRVPID